MNVVFILFVWGAIGSITVWISQTSPIDPTTHCPRPSEIACIECIKDQAAIWKTICVGLLGGFLALIVTWTNAAHAFDAAAVSLPAERALMDLYAAVQLSLISAFTFLGPIYESAVNAIAVSGLFLRCSSRDSVTTAFDDTGPPPA